MFRSLSWFTKHNWETFGDWLSIGPDDNEPLSALVFKPCMLFPKLPTSQGLWLGLIIALVLEVGFLCFY